MQALERVKHLLGRGGYRVYAKAIGRAPTTFHSSVSDPSTITSRLVILSCDLLQQAETCGENAERILSQSGQAFFPSLDGRGGVQIALEACLGAEASERLQERLDMSPASVRNAVSRSDARYHPHFRVIATAMLALRHHGRQPSLECAHQVVQRRH